VLGRKCSDASEVLRIEYRGQDDERASALSDHLLESEFELVRVSHGQEVRVHA
jgi:hypothetical protein